MCGTLPSPLRIHPRVWDPTLPFLTLVCGTLPYPLRIHPRVWGPTLVCGTLPSCVGPYPHVVCGALPSRVGPCPRVWDPTLMCGTLSSCVGPYPRVWDPTYPRVWDPTLVCGTYVPSFVGPCSCVGGGDPALMCGSLPSCVGLTCPHALVCCVVPPLGDPALICVMTCVVPTPAPGLPL